MEALYIPERLGSPAVQRTPRCKAGNRIHAKRSRKRTGRGRTEPGRSRARRRRAEAADPTPSGTGVTESGDEHRASTAFLDALYIPERLGAPAIRPTLRCKAGNRTHVHAALRTRAEARRQGLRRLKLQFMRRIEDEGWADFVRSVAAASGLFVVSTLLGLGLQSVLSPPQGAGTEPPRVFSLTSSAKRPSRSDAAKPAAAEPAAVRWNEQGQVVEVRASDPGSVLVGFCRTMPIDACDPIELAWSDPPHPQLRLGVYRDADTTRAIQIRRVPATRQWVAGDGRQAVGRFLESSLRLSDERRRVRDLR